MARTKLRKWGASVEGLDEIIKLLEECSELAEKAVDAAASKAAQLVEAEAKKRVKVVTGRLKDSITHQAEKNKKTNRKTYRIYSKGVSKGGVRYGGFVEIGQRKRGVKPQPYLRPALDESKAKIIRIVSEEIVKATGEAVN